MSGPTTCPNCGYRFRPARPQRPGIMVICANCAHAWEFVGPRRQRPLGHPAPALRCLRDGLDCGEHSACQENFQPSQDAVERFERYGV